MKVLLKLWGIAMFGIGIYCSYTLVDILFIKGLIANSPTFFVILCLLGLLVGITLIYYGYKLLTINNKGE